MDLRPTKSEGLFLSLGYNRFYDLSEEMMKDSFWEKEGWYRYSRISNVFAIYAELLSYEVFEHVLDSLSKQRPPIESKIGGPLFKFVRNIVTHFPLFETWNEIWVNKSLVNWNREGLTIDRFLKQFCGHDEVKYRFWEPDKKKMTYISIKFPKNYNQEKIYLKDIISEKDGVKFSLIMMRRILDTQVESVGEKPYKRMQPDAATQRR